MFWTISGKICVDCLNRPRRASVDTENDGRLRKPGEQGYSDYKVRLRGFASCLCRTSAIVRDNPLIHDESGQISILWRFKSTQDKWSTAIDIMAQEGTNMLALSPWYYGWLAVKRDLPEALLILNGTITQNFLRHRVSWLSPLLYISAGDDKLL